MTTWSTFEFGAKTDNDFFDAPIDFKLKMKNELREKIAKDTEEFLKHGKITVIPYGVRSDNSFTQWE